MMNNKKELFVASSNKLIEASYRLTLMEKRVILYSICQARENQKGLFPDSPLVIDIRDFAKRWGIDLRHAYAEVRSAIDTLFERQVTWWDKYPDGKDRENSSRWISQKSYIKDSGVAEVIFAPAIIPQITQLSTEFTSYDIERVKNLSSAPTIRLYELLKQYLKIGYREILVVELKTMLCLNEAYPMFKEFNRNVIAPAIKQINKETDLRVSVDSVRKGRSINSLVFKIKPKGDQVVKKQKPPILDTAYIDKHAHPGETYEEAHRRLFFAASKT